MKKNNGTFFIVIGILLIIVGLILFKDDGLIASIGILLGMSNLVKGIRLSRGIKPLIIRKQEEREKKTDRELHDLVHQKSNMDQKNKE